MKDTIVKFDHVNFRRDGNVILDDVSWEIREGEDWVLLGLNGSGKSTLLSMIPAYTYPSKGDVYVFGHRFGSYIWEDIRKRVGFLSSSLNRFQNTLAGERVRDIILSGKFASIGIYQDVEDEDIKRAQGLIEDFELERIANRKFAPLSEGEKRRTLIARAFMADPDLMVLDEPCASLDLRAREKLLSTLSKNLKVEGNFPLIYVTHQIDEIIPEISHVAILDGGKIIHQGKKEEVIRGDILSDLYGIKVKVHWENERPFAIIS